MVSFIEKSIALYKQGNLKKAEKYAHKSLLSDPNNASAYINLGNVFFLQKNFTKALEAYTKAEQLRHDYYYAKINLANTYSELKDHERAIYYAKQSLNIYPESKLAYQILGCSYLDLQKYEESIGSFLHALRLDSTDPWIHNFLSQSYQKNGAWADALRAGWEALKQGPDDDSHHINFGYLLYEYEIEHHDNQAKEYAALWLRHFGRNLITQHMANAILSNQKITKANEQYLQNIFDVFSADFDSVLRDLEYQVPNLINNILAQLYPSSKARLSILDIGCGTGLCGEFLYQYKKWHGLEGVDLSAQMLQQAKQKKRYDKLHLSEAEAFLTAQKNKFDLAIAADVFTYIGDLTNLMHKIFASLKKKGRLIFSVSENKINDAGFFLTPSGRFVHNQLYIKNLLSSSGFVIENIEYKKLRNEGDQPVIGYIFTCQKP